MADEKLEKAAEEEDQTDLWDPTLPPDHPYYNFTKEEYLEDVRQQEEWIEAERKARELNELNERQEELKKLKELVILQNEDGAVFERDWENASADAKRKYETEDFPEFVKKIRSEVLELTLEAMGYSMGVTKNQMARIEAGTSSMTASNMMLMFDQVEKALIRKGAEWYSLGEFEVDQLIPDMYKKLRGWCYGRRTQWHYFPDLWVNNAIPPSLMIGHPSLIPDSDPDKMNKLLANRTVEEREKIKAGELEFHDFEQTKYIEDAKQKVADSPKKKPKEVVIGWAVLERAFSEHSPDRVNDEALKNFQSQIETLTRKVAQQEKKLGLFSVREKEMEEELNRTMEKLETAQKMTAVYEHQMKHNKKMADKGLVDAIIGLPTPTPDQLTVADIEDIPHEVQEKIFKDWRQAEIEDLQADMAADLQRDK